MKKLFASITALLLASATYAAEVSSAVTMADTWITGGGKTVSGLRLTSTNNITVSLYDSFTNIVHFTNSAYTITQTYATNRVVKTTNTLGVIQTNTYPGVFTTTLSVAANTNNPLPVLLSISTAPNTTTTISGLNTAFLRGITARSLGSPASNATLTVIYNDVD